MEAMMVAILHPRQPRAWLAMLPKPRMLTKPVLMPSNLIARPQFSPQMLAETAVISLCQSLTYVSVELELKLEQFAEVMTEVTMEVMVAIHLCQPRAWLAMLPKPRMLTKPVLMPSNLIARPQFSPQMHVETAVISPSQSLTFVSVELELKLEPSAEEATMEAIPLTPAALQSQLTAKPNLGTKSALNVPPLCTPIVSTDAFPAMHAVPVQR